MNLVLIGARLLNVATVSARPCWCRRGAAALRGAGHAKRCGPRIRNVKFEIANVVCGTGSEASARGPSFGRLRENYKFSSSRSIGSDLTKTKSKSLASAQSRDFTFLPLTPKP